jgi:CRISPR-associated protein Csm4
MKEHLIRLNPRSGFEIELHSDTLFGAICWGIRTLFGETKLLSILEEFSYAPPFMLSSAFPWKEQKEAKKTYYLPKPLLPPLTIADLMGLVDKSKPKETYHTEKKNLVDLADKYKKFKKLKWLPVSMFKKVLRGSSEQELFRDYLDKLLTAPRFTNSGVSQKNSLDRMTLSTTGAGETFFTPDIAFREKYGLFFLLKTANFDDYLRPVLMFLQDSGIGPNAKTGKNWFNVDIDETPLLDGTAGNAFITLSRYIGGELLDTEASCYQLTSVRSKVESRLEFAGEDVWKDRVTYFTPGSLLKPLERKVHYGGLVPVKEVAGKTIYQYGYAYPVWLSARG